MTDYLSVIYNEKEKPFTDYPYKLTRYLVERFQLNGNILDLGYGRGEFLCGFIRCGLEGYGIDREICNCIVCTTDRMMTGAKLSKADIENESLPYSSNSFDVVFSKSVLEHLYYPEKIVKEIYRILKPGGLIITMVPDWEAIYKTYFEDYTHRTPFMASSLRDIFLIHGFQDVKVEKFRQLPFLWKMPCLNSLCSLISLLAPRALRPYSKLVKFSQEIMLLGTGRKR